MDRAGQPSKPSIARRIAQRLSAGVEIHDVDPMEGGLSIPQWLQIWSQIHQPTGFGWMRTEWPDGRCLLEQPAIAVKMLELVGNEFMKEEARAKTG